MKFTKSNGLNEESQVNQDLEHYAGKAGEFDYDSNIWKIEDI